MHRSTSSRSTSFGGFIEPLEGRQLFSASPIAQQQVLKVQPAAQSLSTSTSVKLNNKKLLIGQTVVVTVKVKPVKGAKVPTGTVELLDAGRKTGVTSSLNHKGVAVFTFDPGRSIYVGTYSFGARFKGTGSFVGSRSKAVTLAIAAPTLTKLADGLEYGTVTPGKGTGATNGQSLTAQYTGFYASNGSVFDDSASHSPGTFTFTLYSTPEQVITGFDEGTKGMKVGETRVLVIPSALGYKDGKQRIFVIHLVSLK